MPVVKIIEIIGTSTKSFEDAVQEGVKKASVKNGKLTEYRVLMKIAFLVE